MAVYTQLNAEQMTRLLDRYELGRLEGYSEISSGIENTNYFLDLLSPQGASERYVLTLFENLKHEELPFFSDLTRHLAKKGFHVPAPVSMKDAEQVFTFQGKSGVVVPCLQGASVERPGLAQCQAMAEYLAKMHMALRDFARHRPLVRDADWMEQQYAALSQNGLEANELAFLADAITRYKEQYAPALLSCPQGIVHGDLFCDNVLFTESAVSGVIDFYHACEASLLFDLAVMANDWAWDAGAQRYEADKLQAIVAAYQAVRPWTDTEVRAWHCSLEVAALRFWISRLVSKYVPGYQQSSIEGETVKDPDAMKAIIVQARLL